MIASFDVNGYLIIKYEDETEHMALKHWGQVHHAALAGVKYQPAEKEPLKEKRKPADEHSMFGRCDACDCDDGYVCMDRVDQVMGFKKTSRMTRAEINAIDLD